MLVWMFMNIPTSFTEPLLEARGRREKENLSISHPSTNMQKSLTDNKTYPKIPKTQAIREEWHLEKNLCRRDFLLWKLDRHKICLRVLKVANIYWEEVINPDIIQAWRQSPLSKYFVSGLNWELLFLKQLRRSLKGRTERGWIYLDLPGKLIDKSSCRLGPSLKVEDFKNLSCNRKPEN